jgi:Fe-S-cluster containining protein
VKTKRSPKKTRPRRDQLKPGECLCDHCTGKCCRYFSLPIDNPKSWDDYDSIRWYLAHGRTLIYVDKAQWYLLVMTRCQYLTADDRCAIYLNRPKICREYTTANCEYDDDWSFEKIFETPEQIWEYAEAVLPPRRRRKAEGPALPIVTLNGSKQPAEH